MERRAFLRGVGIGAIGLMALKSKMALADTKLFCQGNLNQPLDGQIASNHGHRLLIPRQDVLNGKDKSYDIQGVAGHGHIVIVTEELFAELRKSGSVQLTSGTTLGHMHGITLVCTS